MFPFFFELSDEGISIEYMSLTRTQLSHSYERDEYQSSYYNINSKINK